MIRRQSKTPKPAPKKVAKPKAKPPAAKKVSRLVSDSELQEANSMATATVLQGSSVIEQIGEAAGVI